MTDKKILVIEDNPLNMELVVDLLEPEFPGVAVTTPPLGKRGPQQRL